MIRLDQKYQPAKLDGFIGMKIPKAVLQQFAKKPYSCSWLFLGDSGTGKSTMAIALGAAINAEVHRVPSRKCDLAMVDELMHKCWYRPMNGGFHMVLVDEADRMTIPAQHSFLSKLDTTDCPPDTIFVFTANPDENGNTTLEKRFVSRCRTLKFEYGSTHGELTRYLGRIWKKEVKRGRAPDLKAIAQEADGNIRQALNLLETAILAKSAGISLEEAEPRRQEKSNVVSISEDGEDVVFNPKSDRMCKKCEGFGCSACNETGFVCAA